MLQLKPANFFLFFNNFDIFNEIQIKMLHPYGNSDITQKLSCKGTNLVP